MKTYKIFTSPIGQTEAVKQGWSWPGFCFTFIWTLAKKMWMVSGLLLGGLFVWDLLVESVAFEAPLFSGLIFPVAVGQSGNKLRERNLKARGYEEKETVQAQTPEAALAVWVSKDKSES